MTIELPKETDNLISAAEFRLGYDNQDDPKAMVVNIPIQFCADNPEFGTALLRGKMDEVKQIALQLISQRRQKRARATGVLKPGGLHVS